MGSTGPIDVTDGTTRHIQKNEDVFPPNIKDDTKPEAQTPPREMYAEDHLDSDFTDAPKKTKKSKERPKKIEVVQKSSSAEVALQDLGSTKPKQQSKAGKKKKRGRPRKPVRDQDGDTTSAQSQHVDGAKRNANDTHDATKNEGTRKVEQLGSNTNAENAAASLLLAIEVPAAESEGKDGKKSLEGTKAFTEQLDPSHVTETDAARVRKQATEEANSNPENNTVEGKRVENKSKKPALLELKKPLYRVGLSKRSRIAPLLKSLKKT